MFLRPLACSLLATLATGQTPGMLSRVLYGPEFAFDGARQRIVAPFLSEVWEHDGTHWAPMNTSLPESGHLVYDAAQGRMFLVGAGVHEYDGHSFVPRPGSLGSVPNRVLVDTARSRIVAFGGPGPSRIDEWDGLLWTTVATLPAVTTRLLQGAVYDPVRGVSVFSDVAIGGIPIVQLETWEWDGSALAGPFTSAGTIPSTLMAFDPGLGQVVNFRANGVFAWSGNSWNQVSAVGIPNNIGIVTTDLGNQRILGLASVSGRRDGVWQWQGGAWSAVCAPSQPDMANALVAFEDGRDRMFAFGRTHGTPISAPVVAEWDGQSWSNLPLPGSSTRSAPETPVYDAARGEIVVFGGNDSVAGLLGDTWAWNGTSWRLAATTGPSPRMGAAIAYDSLRGRVMLVGGSGGPTQTSDHWEWDGVAWTQVFASTPMSGIGGVLGFDPVRNRMLFADVLGSAFEYDGVSWSFLVNTGVVPQSTLVWDPTRQHLVGSVMINGTLSRAEWNGTAWLPIAGSYGQLAYDSGHGRMLVLNDLWLAVDSPTLAGNTEVGFGCAVSTLATTVSPFGRARLGNAGFHLDVRADAAIRPLALAFGFGTTNVPLGNGCALYVQNPFASTIWFTDAHGFAEIPTPIPAALALRGVALTAQAGVLDPAAPLGFVLSQGLVFTVGD